MLSLAVQQVKVFRAVFQQQKSGRWLSFMLIGERKRNIIAFASKGNWFKVQ